MALPIDIRLNTPAGRELVDEVKPDVIIAAVGGEPIVLPVPGADGANVIQGAYITDETPIGERVVVIGGGFVGCEEAVDLARKGHRVTILEMRDELAAECGLMSRAGLMHEVEHSGEITQAAGMRCSRITEDGVYAVNSEGKEVLYPADTVVMAAGMRSRSAEVEALRPLVPEFYVIGDANRARQIVHGVGEAYDAVVTMGLY